MRAKLIIAGWLLSLFLMATNNIVLGVVALGIFGCMSYLMNRFRREVAREVIRMERRVMCAAYRLNKLLNKYI
ncbi:hypothetical protein FACS1894169_00820 [Bacteroidia bacterium]|nr:hypothetical protein FACS1894169_00820 [Bacteroidia bacterium]